MIVIEIDETSEGYVYSCKGHAEYAPTGQDIVCAGVSALSLALIAEMNELDDYYDGITVTSRIVENGNISISFRSDENPFNRTMIDTVIDTIKHGLKKIEKLYPDYVKLTEI